MYPIIVINLFTCIGIIYFLKKLYGVRYYYSFEVNSVNWYPSIGVQGYKLSYILKNVNILYTINCTVSIWMYVLGESYKNDFSQSRIILECFYIDLRSI